MFYQDEFILDTPNLNRSWRPFFADSEVLRRWFTWEQIKNWEMDMSQDGGAWIAYTDYAGRRYKAKPGKFIRTKFGVSDFLAQKFAEDWNSAYNKRIHEVKIFSSSDKIREIYEECYHIDGLSSCMTHDVDHYSNTGDLHPVECYGDDSNAHLVVAFGKRGNILARCMYNSHTKYHSRIYAVDDSVKEEFYALLLKGGITDKGEWTEGLILNRYQSSYPGYSAVFPHLDSNLRNHDGIYIKSFDRWSITLTGERTNFPCVTDCSVYESGTLPDFSCLRFENSDEIENADPFQIYLVSSLNQVFIPAKHKLTTLFTNREWSLSQSANTSELYYVQIKYTDGVRKEHLFSLYTDSLKELEAEIYRSFHYVFIDRHYSFAGFQNVIEPNVNPVAA